MPKDTTNPGEFSCYAAPINAPAPVKPSGVTSLTNLYDQITNGSLIYLTDKVRAIEAKKKRSKFKASNLPYVTPNGTASQRDQAFFLKPSGYFIADFDDLKDVELVKKRIINDPTLKPLLVFCSPSGDGLKAFYNIDTSLIDLDAEANKMHKLFYPLNNYLSINYNDIILPDEDGNFICGSGKDLLRACFLCHDAEAFYNPDEQSRIDADFSNTYYKIPEKKKKATKTKVVSVRTTIDDLAARHLIAESHHDHLLSFISACSTCGHSATTILQYIDAHVKISPDSAHSDREKLIKELEDICTRYQSSSPGTVFLTPLEFAFDVFLFKYSKEAGGFVLHGLYREGVRQFLHAAGFWKRYDSANNSILIQQKGQIISETTPEIMRDHLTKHVEQISQSLQFTYQSVNYQIPPDSAREVFLRNSHNIFNDDWMQHLQIHSAPILKDTAKEIFIATKTSLVTVTADSIDQQELTEVKDVCIWQSQRIKRDFTYIHKPEAVCHFRSFMRNVSRRQLENGGIDDKASEENFIALCTAIGYLLHNFTRASEGQAILFYDSAITDIKTPMGGTGKGLIANGIKQIRDVTKIDGKHLDATNRFKFERISMSTQVAWLDDVKNDFDFSMLHTNLTDGWTIERKFMSQIYIEPDDSPKVLICSNSIIKGNGTTNKRRQFVFELGDHYSSKIITGLEKPIEEEHGGLFFTDDWDVEQWNLYFSLLCECAQLYMASGLIPQKAGNINFNRFRQATNDDFAKWCKEMEDVEKKPFKADKGIEHNTTILFNEFAGAYYGLNHKLSQRTFTGWLKLFADYKNWKFGSRRSSGETFFWFECTGNSA